mgnify:FL=1
MSVSYDRFKINALIQMAKITQISSQRERYITLAEEELCKSEKLEIDSIDLFLLSRVEQDRKGRVSRSEVYDKYVTFCENKGFAPSTRNVLYRTMRENGIGEKKVNGIDSFSIRL